MGNCTEAHVSTIRLDGLEGYLKPGLTPEDLVNLKKAFVHLDSERKGFIVYDVNKITDIGKYQGVPVEEGKAKLNFEQFMEVMSNNIANNRKEYGSNRIKFESKTNSAMCFVCPFSNNDKEYEFQPI